MKIFAGTSGDGINAYLRSFLVKELLEQNKTNIKNLAVGLALGVGIIGFGVTITVAEGLTPLPEGQSCNSQI